MKSVISSPCLSLCYLRPCFQPWQPFPSHVCASSPLVLAPSDFRANCLQPSSRAPFPRDSDLGTDADSVSALPHSLSTLPTAGLHPPSLQGLSMAIPWPHHSELFHFQGPKLCNSLPSPVSRVLIPLMPSLPLRRAGLRPSPGWCGPSLPWGPPCHFLFSLNLGDKHSSQEPDYLSSLFLGFPDSVLVDYTIKFFLLYPLDF